MKLLAWFPLLLLAACSEPADPVVNVHVTWDHVDAAPALDAAPPEADAMLPDAQPSAWVCACQDVHVTVCAASLMDAQGRAGLNCPTGWGCSPSDAPCKVID